MLLFILNYIVAQLFIIIMVSAFGGVVTREISILQGCAVSTLMLFLLGGIIFINGADFLSFMTVGMLSIIGAYSMVFLVRRIRLRYFGV